MRRAAALSERLVSAVDTQSSQQLRELGHATSDLQMRELRSSSLKSCASRDAAESPGVPRAEPQLQPGEEKDLS
ncbi:hypothetical protein VULLAG_LOCUS15449 [Vulpes lagopus]